MKKYSLRIFLISIIFVSAWGISSINTHFVFAQSQTISLSNDGNKTVAQGSSAISQITATRLNGFSGGINFSVTVRDSSNNIVNTISPGISTSFSPNPLPSGQTISSLTLGTFSGTPIGTYSVTVTPLVTGGSCWSEADLLETSHPGAGGPYETYDPIRIVHCSDNIGRYQENIYPSSQYACSTSYPTPYNKPIYFCGANNWTKTPTCDYTFSCTTPIVAPSISTTFTLTVTSAVNPAPFIDFNLTNSGNITVQAGNSGSNTITKTLTAGTTQPVTLSVSGLPSGATLNPAITNNPSNPTGSSVLTIKTTASTPVGTYPITVTGEASSAGTSIYYCARGYFMNPGNTQFDGYSYECSTNSSFTVTYPSEANIECHRTDDAGCPYTTLSQMTGLANFYCSGGGATWSYYPTPGTPSNNFSCTTLNRTTTFTLTVTSTVVPYEPPTGVTTALGACVNSVKSVQLSWTAPANLDVIDYGIYRGGVFIEKAGSAFASSAPSYIDHPPEGTYTYSVSALYVGDGGVIGESSLTPASPITVTACSTTYSCVGNLPAGATMCSGDDVGLAGPTNWTSAGNSSSDCTATKCEHYTPLPGTPLTINAVTSSTCGGKIDVSWSSSSGATSYSLYREGTSAAIYVGPGRSFPDTVMDGLPHRYRVLASNSSGDSPLSSYTSSTSPSPACVVATCNPPKPSGSGIVVNPVEVAALNWTYHTYPSTDPLLPALGACEWTCNLGFSKVGGENSCRPIPGYGQQ
ncbi:MAG: hypothetical protein ABI430_03175 [Candidatus Taylorbacteria bacterium]